MSVRAHISAVHVRPPESSRPGQGVISPPRQGFVTFTSSSSTPPVSSPPPACPPVWLGSRLEQRARCCELERHFNNISAIRTLHRSHSRAPPQPRGVNSRAQIRRPARLIHHPISFVWFLLYFSLSLCLSFTVMLCSNWKNATLTTQRWRNRFKKKFVHTSAFLFLCVSLGLEVAISSLIKGGNCGFIKWHL